MDLFTYCTLHALIVVIPWIDSVHETMGCELFGTVLISKACGSRAGFVPGLSNPLDHIEDLSVYFKFYARCTTKNLSQNNFMLDIPHG